MKNKYSGYDDRKGTPLNDGDYALIEYFERGYWTDYNTVKIVVSGEDVLVTEYVDVMFAPAPASITTFMNDKNFRFTKKIIIQEMETKRR